MGVVFREIRSKLLGTSRLVLSEEVLGGKLNRVLVYQTGGGVTKDFLIGAYFFKMAAYQGILEAQMNYGPCLLEGHGVAKDC